MKAFYNEYFHIPKNGKISEKVMLVRVASIVVTMVACLIAMSLSAYAYFSHSVTSGSNVIKAADFDVNVAVTVTPNDTSATKEANDDGSYSLTSGTYSVNLEKAGTATTGFCIVEITVGANTAEYHTQQIGVGGVEKILTFTLDLSELSDFESAVIEFTPHWGTSSFYGYKNEDANKLYIQDKATVKISVGGSVSLLVDSNEEENAEIPPDQTDGVDTENTEPAEVVHIVQSDDTLTAISKQYGVSVEKIAAYNNIKDANVIESGQRIVIPPSDWEIPDDDTESQE